jgi:very-short-patch-repair endonuclease
MQGSSHARELRRRQTEAERLLWRRLRDRRLDHRKFRRQLQFGPYILDFVCVSARLVVELDGGQHAETRAYDAARTAFLEQSGFRVLRFWNIEVFQNLDGVLTVILAALCERGPSEALTPDPSPAGEGRETQ